MTYFVQSPPIDTLQVNLLAKDLDDIISCGRRTHSHGLSLAVKKIESADQGVEISHSLKWRRVCMGEDRW